MGVFRYQVKAIQLNEPRVAYIIELYRFFVWNDNAYAYPSLSEQGIMLKQFPNLDVFQVDPCIELQGFRANKAYINLTTYHNPSNKSNTQVGYFMPKPGQLYCLKQNKYREVTLNTASNCSKWIFIMNLTFQNLRRRQQIYYLFDIIVDQWLNGSEIASWDHSQQKCIIQIPPSPAPPAPISPVSPPAQPKVSPEQFASWKIAVILVSILIPIIVALVITGVVKGWFRGRRQAPQNNYREGSGANGTRICLEQRPQQAQQQQQEAQESPTCTICLDEGPNYALIACAHTFHGACIRAWLATRTTCPNCVRQVDREQIGEIMAMNG